MGGGTLTHDDVANLLKEENWRLLSSGNVSGADGKVTLDPAWTTGTIKIIETKIPAGYTQGTESEKTVDLEEGSTDFINPKIPEPTEPAPTDPAPEYQITYNLNGGQFNGKTDDIIEYYPAGTVINIHEAPTKEGYRFTYWKGSEYKPGDKYTVTEDHTFTAQYEKLTQPVPVKGNTPATGDTSGLFIYLPIAGAAAFCIFLMLRKRRKKTKIITSIIILAGAFSAVTAASVYAINNKDEGFVINKIDDNDDPVEGAVFDIYGKPEVSFVIPPTPGPELTEISGTKTWDDDNNRDGKRPEEITVRLHADGLEIDSKKVSEADDWSWTFTGLPKTDGNREIIYTVTEDKTEDYTAIYSSLNYDYDITNVYTPEKTFVTVEKIWEDADDRDGVRPESVTVRLFADGVDTGKTLVLDAADKWMGEFTGLDEYNDGKLITYTVKEEDSSKEEAHYTSTVTGDAVKGFTITNTHTPETVSLSGSKIWRDAQDNDGKRPESITLRLHADGKEIRTKQLSAAEGWTWEFADLPKHEEGRAIVYTVTEDTVENYTHTWEGDNLVNDYTPGKTEISVSKIWDDDNDRDGARPASVTVKLFADGIDTGKTLTLNAADKWSGDFKDLDEYRDGKKISYTVEEEMTGAYTVAVTGDATRGYTLTNTYTPETTEVSFTKTWDDNDNQDGHRPAEITIRLHADGVEVNSVKVTETEGWKGTFTNLPKYKDGKEIIYTVTEDATEDYTAIYSTTRDDCDVVNKYTPGKTFVNVEKVWDDKNDQDGIRPLSVTLKLFADGKDTGKSIILTAAEEWLGEFTDLDDKKAGKKIVYTVEEEKTDVITGIDAAGTYATTITGDAVKGFTVTNVHTPELIHISGSKVWDDENNKDGKRPENVIIRLHADGVEIDETKVSDKTDNKWTFEELPKYKEGRLINYTVTEDSVSDYNAGWSGSTLTNKYTPGKTDITVEKAWEDGNNQDGNRPETVEIMLYADGVDTGKFITLDEKSKWVGGFSDLDEYKDGKKISYTVEELVKDNVETPYRVSVSGDAVKGFTITNEYTPETVSVPFTKVWDDKDNQDGHRPDNVTIRLHGDGKEIDSVKVGKDQNWKGSFDNLPKYKDGEEILYTITEDATEDYTAIYDVTAGEVEVTNEYTPGKTSVTVEKAWDDKNDQDGARPANVTVKLLADGKDTGETLILSSRNNWMGEFTGLDEYKNGVKISYTVEELATNGYTAVVSGDAVKGYTITNTHVPETVQIKIEKEWKDEDLYDAQGNPLGDYKRPDSVNVVLTDTEPTGTDTQINEVSSAVISADSTGKWNAVITVPKYEKGSEIDYEDYYLAEDPVPAGYGFESGRIEKQADGSYEGKVWNYAWVREEFEPLEFDLYKVDNATVTEDRDISNSTMLSGAKFTLTNETDDTDVVALTTDRNGKATHTFTKECTYILEETEAPANYMKAEGTCKVVIRKDSLTVVKLDVDTGEWVKTYDMYVDFGAPDQGTAIKGFLPRMGYDNTLWNSWAVPNRSADNVEIKVTKVWDDGGDQDGKRPDTITFKLYQANANDGSNAYTYTFNTESGNSQTITIDEDDQGNPLKKYSPSYVTENGGYLEWEYSVEEVIDSNSPYTVSYEDSNGNANQYGTDNGGKIINKYTPETRSVTITKTWDDNAYVGSVDIAEDEYEYERPAVTFTLIGKVNGSQVSTQDVTLTSSDIDSTRHKWIKEITNLPKYNNGVEIEYTATEKEVPAGFEKTASDATSATNKPIKDEDVNPLALKIIKTEADTGNLLQGATFEIIKSGATTGDITGATNANGETSYEFAEEGTYTIKEKTAPTGYKLNPDGVTVTISKELKSIKLINSKWIWGYELIMGGTLPKDITGNATTGYTLSMANEPETVSISVKKVWDDNGDNANVRPSKVRFKLFADGRDTGFTNDVSGTSATNEWTLANAFTDMRKYNSNGQEIVYTVKEDNEIPESTQTLTGLNYTADESQGNAAGGYTITNTYSGQAQQPELVEIVGRVNWENDEPIVGFTYPEYVTVKLQKQSGTSWSDVDTMQVPTKFNESVYDGQDSIEFSANKYESDGSTPVVYRVVQVHLDGFTWTGGEESDGYVISNSLNLVKIELDKTWDDDEDENGDRPSPYDDEDTFFGNYLDLKRNGIEYNTTPHVEESDLSSYKVIWNLPAQDADGNEYTYSLSEKPIPHYTNGTMTYDDSDQSYAVTNTYNP